MKKNGGMGRKQKKNGIIFSYQLKSSDFLFYLSVFNHCRGLFFRQFYS